MYEETTQPEKKCTIVKNWKTNQKKKDKTLKRIFMEIYLKFLIQLPGVVPFRSQIIVILE